MPLAFGLRGSARCRAILADFAADDGARSEGTIDRSRDASDILARPPSALANLPFSLVETDSSASAIERTRPITVLVSRVRIDREGCPLGFFAKRHFGSRN